MWKRPQRRDSRDAKVPPTFSRRLADLFARDWSDIRNVPAHVRKRFDDRDDKDDQKRQMHEQGDETPEHGQKPPDGGDAIEDQPDNRRDDVEENPNTAKDDRLHGVK